MEIPLPDGYGNREEAMEAIIRDEIAAAQAELPEIRHVIYRYLKEIKGFSGDEIETDRSFSITVGGESLTTSADIILVLDGKRTVLVKCFAGALVSRERHALACARLAENDYQIPYALVTDARTATLLDTLTGATLAEGISAIPSRSDLVAWSDRTQYLPLAEARREKEQRILAAFDTVKCSFPTEE